MAYEVVSKRFEPFDKSVKPADDFFEYVNGVWIKNNPIPSDQSRWGAFTILGEEARRNIGEIFEELSVMKDAATSAEEKLRDFYLSGMNSAERDLKRFSPLKPELEI